MELIPLKKTGINEIDEFFEALMKKIPFSGFLRVSQPFRQTLMNNGTDFDEESWESEYTTREVIPDNLTKPEEIKTYVEQITFVVYYYEEDGRPKSAVEVFGEDCSEEGMFYNIYLFDTHISRSKFFLFKRLLEMQRLAAVPDNEIKTLYDLFIEMETAELAKRRMKNGLARIIFSTLKTPKYPHMQPINAQALAKIKAFLTDTSPAGNNIPLNCTERSGWTLFRIPSFPNPMVYAEGVYCGFAGKEKLFEIEGEEFVEVKSFYSKGNPEDFYVEIKGRMGG